MRLDVRLTWMVRKTLCEGSHAVRRNIIFVLRPMICCSLLGLFSLADRVRQVELLKAEKARTNKFHKKEKVVYLKVSQSKK